MKELIENEVLRRARKSRELFGMPRCLLSSKQPTSQLDVRKSYLASQANNDGRLETKKMSHIQKLDAIKDKIKLDMSDGKIKKEHYHLLSNSLWKPDKVDFVAAKTSSIVLRDS